LWSLEGPIPRQQDEKNGDGVWRLKGFIKRGKNEVSHKSRTYSQAIIQRKRISVAETEKGEKQTEKTSSGGRSCHPISEKSLKKRGLPKKVNLRNLSLSKTLVLAKKEKVTVKEGLPEKTQGRTK